MKIGKQERTERRRAGGASSSQHIDVLGIRADEVDDGVLIEGERWYNTCVDS